MSGRNVPACLTLVVISFMIGFIIIFALSCSRMGLKETATLRIGVEPNPVNSLVYIADSQGFFKDNNINAVISDRYASGTAASEAMLEGEVEFSTASEFFIVNKAFERRDFVCTAVINYFTHMKLIIRNDRGINIPDDLRGKRIGVPLYTAGDFMFGRFMDLQQVSLGQVDIVDVQARESLSGIENGIVDAVVTWEPYVFEIKKIMGNRVTVWDVQSGQPLYCTLLCTAGRSQNHPGQIKALLESLVQAERYMQKDPEEAKNLVANRLGYQKDYIEASWPGYMFHVGLDQSFITAMEDQARWVISHNLTSKRDVPDFLSFIDETILESLEPEAVDVIR